MSPDDERFTHPSLEGVFLNTLRWGEPGNSPLVLLHGAAANAHWWDHVAPRLGDAFHVVALDFRGHGRSDFPTDFAPDALALDLEATLGHLGREDAVIVGHSLGAHVALSHAARHPGTRALVLVDPSRGAPKGSRRRARLALRIKPSHSTRERAIARYRFLPLTAGVPEPLRIHVAEHSVVREGDDRFGYRYDPRALGVRSAPPVDPRRVRCPSLVVRGERSPLLSETGAAELAIEMGGSVRTIAGAGHHVMMEQPDALIAVLREFLTELC